MSEHLIVTIARQHGSGGRSIGKMLARQLGVECYDRKLLQLAAKETGVSESLFGRSDEIKTTTLLERITKPTKVYAGEVLGPDDPDYLTEENLFNLQAKVIKGLAETEDCVIIGRCADHILRNKPNVVRVFIYAPQNALIERVVERDALEPEDAEKSVSRIDKKRGEYYRFHTGKHWTDAHNYDLCLDSSKLTPEQCVEMIRNYIRMRGLEK